MRCLRCNNDYNEVYQTCPYCGTPRYNDTQPIMPQKKKSNGGLIALLIVIIIFIAGVTVAACMLLMQPKNTVTVSADSQFGEQLSLGEKYLSEENYDEAIIAFKKAIDIRPNEPEPYLKLADVYVEKNDYQNALSTLEDGYAKTNDTAIATRLEEIKSVITYNTLIKEGEEALSDKNYDTAVSKFEEAIKLRNDEVQPYLSASEAYLGKKDTDGAKKILEQGYEKTHSAEIKEKLDSLPSMEKAYLSVVEDLINQYGEGKTVNETTDEHKGLYAFEGVAIVRLLDLDNDSNDELLCIHSEDVTGNNSTGKVYILDIYSFDGEKANNIYHNRVTYDHYRTDNSWTPIGLDYFSQDGKILLLTKANPMTWQIEEWSELKDGEVVVLKTLSDMPQQGETPPVYRIDDVIVDEATFRAETEKIRSNVVDLQCNGAKQETLSAYIAETNETLKKLEYTKSATVDNDDSETNKVKSEQWKKLYIDYIQKNGKIKDSFNHYIDIYKLVDINGDEIPELYINYGTTAGGDALCSYHNGKLIEQRMYNYGLSYMEGQNLFCDSGGHMDRYYDKIYSIKDDKFVLLYEGEYGAEDNSNLQRDENGYIIYSYKWNGKEVSSKSEYDKLLNDVYQKEQAKNPFTDAEYNRQSMRYEGNGLCDYYEIIEAINQY